MDVCVRGSFMVGEVVESRLKADGMSEWMGYRMVWGGFVDGWID